MSDAASEIMKLDKAWRVGHLLKRRQLSGRQSAEAKKLLRQLWPDECALAAPAKESARAMAKRIGLNANQLIRDVRSKRLMMEAAEAEAEDITARPQELLDAALSIIAGDSAENPAGGSRRR